MRTALALILAVSCPPAAGRLDLEGARPPAEQAPDLRSSPPDLGELAPADLSNPPGYPSADPRRRLEEPRYPPPILARR